MSLEDILLWMKKTYQDRIYPYELEEPMKIPDDIIEAIERSKQTGDHLEIHHILRNRNINLGKNKYICNPD